MGYRPVHSSHCGLRRFDCCAGAAILSPWQWDDRSWDVRAKWRADHDLLAGVGALDLPYLVAVGQGILSGVPP